METTRIWDEHVLPPYRPSTRKKDPKYHIGVWFMQYGLLASKIYTYNENFKLFSAAHPAIIFSAVLSTLSVLCSQLSTLLVYQNS